MNNLPNLPELFCELSQERFDAMSARLDAQAHEIWHIGACSLSEYEDWTDEFLIWHAKTKKNCVL